MKQANVKITSDYATRTVPRYTSYPTAPHFNSDLTGADVAGWLSALRADEPLSIYLHVPYCREMCAYCGCHTKITKRTEPLIEYAETLRSEIALVRNAIGRRQPVSHIHWGGGTPSILPEPAFRRIVEDLEEAFHFTETLEHAIEIDPRTVSDALISTFGSAGINRASLGVQDFDLTVQKAIGRLQPFEQVRRTVDGLRRAGIKAINFDLIYGLPHQTPEGFTKTANQAADLQPSRISLFGYAHVPWFKKHQRLIDEAALPGAAQRLELERTAREVFQSRGYEPIGLDHFALPDDSLSIAARSGTMRRNFQGYTTDTADALIGLGASSISKLPGGYAQNAPDLGNWRRSVSGGSLAVTRGRALSEDDQIRGAIIEDLMTNFEADYEPLAIRSPEAIKTIRADLEQLRQDGLVTLTDTGVRMTPEARSLVRVAAAVFDAYLENQTAKHSVAV